ncbi:MULTISPECIES: DedA family protein [unclassified Paenibacillus]|uniref:DedA family protein n=1 Tax=unclassified Paenibacillus TaxID=185978 RepID=UPI0009548AD8|nr:MULTISPECIES: DedA family protein [unclassified Paenibacillus]ASS66752.1 DedA family protein [Paenibacillus sp. RUD330]SIP96456.1 membrane protein DedA, SNARE-associated domain [Paenibacillus sp. RU4X]SIQ15025.1 membrane protein DedA, SNARE-associated domain [Paenibacillus sp. RU4T]
MHLFHELVTYLLGIVEKLGYFGIILGLAMEVIPSEIVLGYAGYMVSTGSMTFWGAVLCGTIGAILQQWILYAIGLYGGRPFLDKYGKYIKIKPKHIDIAEGWFQRYGPGMVFTARFVPVMRQVISIPAGMARMPLSTFTLLTAIASLPWSILFVYIGRSLGSNWEQIKDKAAPYTMPAILVAAAVLIMYVLFKYLRSRGRTV